MMVPLTLIMVSHSPVILENIPNFADGSAYFTPIDVNTGEDVVNTAGDLVPLQAGVQVFPTGCTNINCAITWNGTTPLKMDYLTATYKLKPRSDLVGWPTIDCL